MAKLVNLRTRRKQTQRAKVQAQKKQRLDASANLKKPERERIARLNAFEAHKLDAHKRDPDA